MPSAPGFLRYTVASGNPFRIDGILPSEPAVAGFFVASWLSWLRLDTAMNPGGFTAIPTHKWTCMLVDKVRLTGR
jgi:hypothetical protein